MIKISQLLKGFSFIIDKIKTHDFKKSIVNTENFDKISDLLFEFLEVTKDKESLVIQLEVDGIIDFAGWNQYQKKLDILTFNIESKMKNNLTFAMKILDFKKNEQSLQEAIRSEDYLAANDLKRKEYELQNEILITWVDYYLYLAETLGILNEKINFEDKSTIKDYLIGFKLEIQHSSEEK